MTIGLISEWVRTGGTGVWILLAAAVTMTLGCGGAMMLAGGKKVFPGESWERRSPEELDIDPRVVAQIDEKMKIAGANGALVRHGYLVAEWTYNGPADQRIDTQSITKSITSMALGLALKEGKIGDIHDKVVDYFPAFDGGPHTREITFWHLVTATSGMGGPNGKPPRWNFVDPGYMEPGKELRYHNEHTSKLAEALTYLFEEHLENVIRRRALGHIGADVTWHNDGSRIVTLSDGVTQIPVAAGFAWSNWTALDLARVGWLYANAGQWNGQQILDAAYTRQCMTAVALPVQAWRDPWTGSDTKLLRYGLAWRGRVNNDGEVYWYMSGNGGQFNVVLPERGIVFTKINNHRNTPRVLIEDVEPLIFSLVAP